MLELWDGDKDEWQMGQLFIWICTNQITSWLVHNLSIFGARMSHMHTRTHKLTMAQTWEGNHHLFPYSIIYDWPWGLHLNFMSQSLQYNEFWPFKLLSKDLGFHNNSNSQSGNPFESVWVHSVTFFHLPGNVNVTPGLHSWPTPFHALTLVASPKLRSWHRMAPTPLIN
jgi:hypothetical protein